MEEKMNQQQKPVCPRCGSSDIRFVKKERIFYCRRCGYEFKEPVFKTVSSKQQIDIDSVMKGTWKFFKAIELYAAFKLMMYVPGSGIENIRIGDSFSYVEIIPETKNSKLKLITKTPNSILSMIFDVVYGRHPKNHNELKRLLVDPLLDFLAKNSIEYEFVDEFYLEISDFVGMVRLLERELGIDYEKLEKILDDEIRNIVTKPVELPSDREYPLYDLLSIKPLYKYIDTEKIVTRFIFLRKLLRKDGFIVLRVAQKYWRDRLSEGKRVKAIKLYILPNKEEMVSSIKRKNEDFKTTVIEDDMIWLKKILKVDGDE